MDLELVKYEQFISKRSMYNGIMNDFNLSVEISKKSFIQKFKRHYKIAPNQYLKLKKVNEAIRLIENNRSHSLTEIGLSSGFYDQSHFIKTFKKFCGYSPKDHLKNIQR